MEFEQRTNAVFEAGGLLSRHVEFYQPRSGQIQMAAAIARTMDAGGMLAVEAGTGTGKTFAYLVPALLSGEPVLVSTATKALQDQLFLRDIPFLKSVLGVAVSTALLKGRASYLCTHRLESVRLDAPNLSGPDLQQLASVELWAMRTRSGDLAEVDGLHDSSALLPWISSTRDNCLGSNCPQASTCYVNQARRQAMAADLVVVNHHLFFADLNVRESGVAELLPTVRTVIFDEAHQLNETGVQFLGSQWSTGQVASFAADLLKLGQSQARGLADWVGIAAQLGRSADGLRQRCAGASPGKMAWGQALALVGGMEHWLALTQAVQLALEQALLAVQQVQELGPAFQSMHERGLRLHALLALFSQAVPGDSVRWVDMGFELRCVQSPLDIAASMQSRVLSAAQDSASHKSWIFTSATLGSDASLAWFVESCGLQGAEVLQVASPFDYAKQAALYIPQPFPEPRDAGHSQAVAGLALQGARILGGRTLVLTTTLRAMRAIADSLRMALQGHDDLEVLVQGQRPKRALIEAFGAQQDSGPPTRGMILVASVSFWEGIDIAGDALQLLVIDKLPFAPPDDPVQTAKAQSLEAKGLSAFKLLHLPHAAIALKQGAGRLIRRETDQGVLVVCDARMAQMGYGKQLVKVLPPMQRLRTREEFAERLQALTRVSTTDQPWCARP